jgi:hypothetical protein
MTITHDGEVLLTDFGAVADDSTDCYPAFEAAKAWMINEVGTYYGSDRGRPLYTLRLPKGRMRSSQTWHLKGGTMHIKGYGAGIPGGVEGGTRVKFAAGQSGIVVHHWDTDGLDPLQQPLPTVPAGMASCLEDFEIHSLGGKTGGDVDGVWLRAVAYSKRLVIAGFGRHGYRIEGSENGAGGYPEGGPNMWRLWDVHADACGGDGLHVAGFDANAGVAVGFNASNCGGRGINDESFLGNTYIAPHTNNNELESYRCIGGNARSVFIAPYAEGNQLPADIRGKSYALGGLLGDGLTDQSNFIAADPNGLVAGASIRLEHTNQHITFGDSLGLGILGVADAGNFGTKSFVLQHEGKDIDAAFKNSGTLFTLTGPQTTNKFGKADPVLPSFYARRLVVGHINATNSRQITYSNVIPASGQWARGDVAFNVNPVTGGSVGWVCVAGGTPGTWKTFGAIAL